MRPFVSLALLVGLTGGAVIAALDGAGRTDRAYPQFLRHARASDLEIGVEKLNGEEVPFLQAIEALPQVVEHARRAYVFLVPTKADGEPDLASSLLGQTLVAVDDRMFSTIDGEKVIAGRRADPRRADEITVGRELVRRFHVRVGQAIPVASWSPARSVQVLEGESGFVAPDGPRLRLHVVGEVVSPGELAAASFDNTPVHLTPAFFRTYNGRIGMSEATRVRLRRPAVDLPAVRAAADRLAGHAARLGITEQQGLTAKVQRSIHLQALSLRLFGLLAAVAGALIVGQALGRQLVIAGDEHPILRGIGMSRGQLVSLSVARAAAVGAAGAVLALLLALALSALAPVGLARVVAPTTGVQADWATLFAGGALVVTVTVVMAAWPAWRAARTRGLAGGAGLVDTGAGRSRVADAMARAGLSPSAVTGTRLALEPGSGRTAVPVRSTIVGTVLAVAAVAAAVTFGASLSRLIDTPRLYGWSWDVTIGNPYAFDLSKQVAPGLVHDRDVGRVAAVAASVVSVDHHTLTALGIQPLRGTIYPPLVSGRSPSQPDELTVGPKTLRALHRHVGDTVTVAGVGGSRRMRIVGTAVYPSIGVADPGGVGAGAGLTYEGLTTVVPEAPRNLFPIVLAPGADPDRVVDRLQKEYAIGQVDAFRPMRPTDVENYIPVRPVPVVLAGLLGVTALGALTHTLVTSVRRRRRDLALLKTLGFVRGQVRMTVAWQATVLATVALVVGLPVGVAVGRWAWRVYAAQQGVVPEPAVPLLVLAALVPAMLVVVNLIAALPAGSAARTRPGLVLRVE